MIKNKKELLDKLYSIKANLVAMEDEVADCYRFITKKYKDLNYANKNYGYNYKLNPYYSNCNSIDNVHVRDNIQHIDELINSFEQRVPKTNNVQDENK